MARRALDDSLRDLNGTKGIPESFDRLERLLVEKILSHGELMRPDWPAHGTTGYGFLNLLNGVFVERANEGGMRRLYERFTGEAPDFADLTYECKKLILRVAMSSESHVLARRLDRISEQRRFSRDFTLNSLQYALDEVIACFPVYRSYTRKQQAEVCQEDRRHIIKAVGEAKRRNPATSPSVFDFIGKLLLLEDPAGLSDEQRDARRDFILRFQQLTGPVTAKGVEDTAFYRYYPLVALNEVGGEPQRFGITVGEFHDLNAQRMVERPHGLSATSTHDANRFLRSFAEFHAPIARAGMYNSLAQTLLKITSPGVPDFYQGAELWDFSLVDPDNRRPVDFAKRRASLASVATDDGGDLTELVSRLIANPQDGRIKLYLTSRALRFRRARQALFAEGDYLPLTARGQKESHIIAFARAAANQTAVVVTGRFFTRLGDLSQPPTRSGVWGESVVEMDHAPAGTYRDVFTGRLIRAEAELPLAQVFAHLPVALLERVKKWTSRRRKIMRFGRSKFSWRRFTRWWRRQS